MKAHKKTWWPWASSLVLVFAVTLGLGQRYWRAVTLLERLGAESAEPLGVREARVTLGERRIPARLYYPPGEVRQRLVVLHGVHHLGIDEPRLVRFSRELARVGCLVVTPKLASLTEYQLDRAALGEIAVAVHEASRLGSERRHAVGLIGFSFAGGLALRAAAEEGLGAELDYVANVGGHHDLERVMHFLVDHEVVTPSGTRPMRAHEYGLVIAVYQNLDRLVPRPDQRVMHDAFLYWLEEDRDAAWSVASERTTPEAERVFRLLVDGRLAELRAELEPLIAEQSAHFRSLSPRGVLARIDVPVFWLHGAGDNVIPPSESAWAALERPERTFVLVSPLVEHVEVSHHAGVYDELSLVHFMARLI